MNGLVGFRLPAVAAIVSAGLLSACATPSPGPNVAANAVQAPADTPLATKPSTGQEAKAVANDKITVDFKTGSATLDAASNRKLDVAARLFRDANPVLMFTTGHADKAGDEYANLLLSAKRAQVVKKALVARGIPADRLLLQAMGTSEPVATGDAAPEGNRSVVVTWRLL